MKKKLPVILAAAAALALIVGYLLLNADAKSVERTGVLFTPKDGETVTAIQIKNTYGDFTFTPEDGAWTVSDGAGEYRTNADKMKLLTASLLNFKVLRLLGDIEDSYGLASPQAAVSFTTSTGRECVILMGGACANASENYVRADGVDGAIITDAASVAQLTGSLAAYRSNDVFSVDIASICAIEYTKDGADVVKCQKDGGEWSVTWPFTSGARKIEINEFISALWGWSVADYAEGADYGELGLDAPTETLTFTDGSGVKQTIELGAVNGTLRYARLGAQDDVVALYNTDIDLSVLSPEALIYENPTMISVGSAQELSITVNGKTYDFAFDTDAETAKLNGTYIDYQDFIGVYYRYVLLLADGWDAETAPGQLTAELTVTDKSGNTNTLRLYERDEDTIFMSYDGKEDFYMDASRFSDLTDRLESLG